MRQLYHYMMGALFVCVFLAATNTNAQQWVIFDTGNSGIAANGLEIVKIDQNGEKWMAHWGAGVSRFDGTNWTIYNTGNSGLPNDFARSMNFDSQDTAWIGTAGGGMASFDGSNWVVYNTGNSGIPDDNVRYIGVLNDTIWPGTSFGAAEFDHVNWVTYNTGNSNIPGDVVRGIAFENNNHRWFGTNLGVGEFDGTIWTTYNTGNSGLPNDLCRHIIIDGSSQKWICTVGGGLAVFNGNAWVVYHTNNSPIPSDNVNSVAIDANNVKWISTDGGIGEFDGNNWTIYDSNNSPLPVNGIAFITIDACDTKWIATFGGGLVAFKAWVATISASQDVSCNGGNDGSATATPTGGSSPYTYAWSSGGNQSTETGLSTGTYTVTITDNNGCLDTVKVTINEPALLVAGITNSTNALCANSTDGDATVAATGGTTPYTYTWSSGGTNATETGLGPGTYVVTVTDSLGCTDTSLVIITSPPAIVITGSSVNSTCGNADGSAIATVSGGVSPYGYAWSSGGSNSTENNLSAGAYQVTVTDNNGCTEIATVIVSDQGAPTLSVNNFTNVSCNAMCDGDATVSATGGTSPYSYLWDANAGNQTTAQATALCAGSYIVTVTDNNGCVAVISVNITEPAPLTITGSSNPTTGSNCDGDATVTPSGGTSPYSYIWDSNTSNQTSQTATGLCGGNAYCVTVTDNNGCTKDTCIQVATGIDEYGMDLSSMSVYPNPTNGELTIDIHARKVIDLEITLFDITGQLVYSDNLSISAGNYQQQLNLRHLAPGVYQLQLTTPKGNLSRAVIIQ